MSARASKAYFQAREQQELALVQSSSDRAIQSIHLDLAKRYADLVHDEDVAAILAHMRSE